MKRSATSAFEEKSSSSSSAAAREKSSPIEASRKSAPEYEYISLLEAARHVKPTNEDGGAKDKVTKDDLISCYGVVLSHTTVKELPKGRASKFMASLFIADPSMPYSVATNVCLNIFADSLDQIPVVQAAGDIIRCHRVKVQNWNGLQLVGTMKAAKRGNFSNAAFVTFHSKFDPTTGLPPQLAAAGDSGEGARRASSSIKRRMSAKGLVQSLNPELWDVHSSSAGFSFHEETEMPRLMEYNGWSANMLASQNMRDKITPTFNLGRLNQIVRNSLNGVPGPLSCDVICIFVGLRKNPPQLPVLLVWDGSTEGSLSSASLSHHTRPHMQQTTLPLDSRVGSESYTPEDALVSMNAALHASNIYSTCLDLQSVNSMRDRINAFRKKDACPILPGEPSLLTIGNKRLIELFEQIVPGTWIRIRNLKVPAHNEPRRDNNGVALIKQCIISEDTHVVVLPPYAADASQIASELDGRMRKMALQLLQNPNSFVASATNGSNNGIPPPANIGRMNAPRVMASAAGEELTNLALMLSTPAPAKFCVRACISDYWPKDISDFTVDSAVFHSDIATATGQSNQSAIIADMTSSSKAKSRSKRAQEAEASSKALDMITQGEGSTQREFLFAIRLADDTGETDVILSGKDAEYFLGGVTATEFYEDINVENDVEAQGDKNVIRDSDGNIVNARNSLRPNAGIANKLRKRLEQCVEVRKNWLSASGETRARHILQCYVRSYTDNIGLQTASNSPSKTKALPTAFKRFSAFNTKLF